MIHHLPNDHLALSCDLEGCAIEGPIKRGISEHELLDIAEAQGWQIWREIGLHYCPLSTMHECDDCGAPTRESITDAATGEQRFYCAEHWSY